MGALGIYISNKFDVAKSQLLFLLRFYEILLRKQC